MENKAITIQEAEKRLQAICSDFTIVPNPNSDLAGIFWKGSFAEISVPKDYIYERKNEGHMDAYGHPHRGMDVVEERAKAFLERIERDPEYVKDITTPFDHTILEGGEGEIPEPAEMLLEE